MQSSLFFELSLKLRDPGNTHIDFLDFVSGGVVYDSGFREAENVLEFPDGSLGLGAVYAVRIYFWKSWISLADGV